MQPIKVVTFGRSSRNDVVLHDAKASRVHCQIIQYDNGTFVISDFGSTNGTYVNGRRVVGTMLLNWSDQVVVGNTTIQWQYYFNGSGGTTGTGDKQKSSALPLVLGIVGGVIGVVAIVLVILLLTRGHGNTHHPPREYHIGGVSLDFNMSQDDLFNENPNAIIVAKHAPSGALPAHDYYVINNNMAVTFEQTNNVQESYVNQIVVWDPTFVINNIHVGDPCSRVMNEYNVDKSSNNTGTLSFWYVSSWYDYRSENFTGAICVYDASTCTGYLLFKNEFSASLWQGVTAAAGHVTSTGEFSFAALSASTYQSIYSSVTVSQIVKYNCNKGPAASPFTPHEPTVSPVEPEPTPQPTPKPHDTSASTEAVKQAYREWFVALSLLDFDKLRYYSSNAVYNRLKEEYNIAPTHFSEEEKRKVRLAVSECPMEVTMINNTDATLRMYATSHGRGNATARLKIKNGHWVIYELEMSGPRGYLQIP